MKKPFIFVGDSITWGEGLELYNDDFREFYETIKPNEEFNFIFSHDILFSGFAPMYREQNRFATKVAQHYDTFCISNGMSGTNIDSFDYVRKILEKYGKDNFSHVILNLSSTIHDEHITSKEKLIELFDLEFKPFQLQKILECWYNFTGEHGVNTEIASDEILFNQFFEKAEIEIEIIERLQSYFFQPDNFRNFLVENSYNFYEDKLKWFIDNEVDIHFILPWQRHDYEDYKKLSQKFDLDIASRAINIIYNDSKYESLSELIDVSELWISNDFEWSNSIFVSPMCHELIEKSIIKHLDNLK